MQGSMDAKRLEQLRRAAVKAREQDDKHVYFQSIASARYILRKVFRMVEERARSQGLEPLEHQGLLQIYGSPARSLRVKDLAERLDIAPAFGSRVASVLVEKGYAQRSRSEQDQRETQLSVTPEGVQLLYRIDEAVQFDVEYFNRELPAAEKELAVSTLLFYVGASLT